MEMAVLALAKTVVYLLKTEKLHAVHVVLHVSVLVIQLAETAVDAQVDVIHRLQEMKILK